MAENEKTSDRVASLAARILTMDRGELVTLALNHPDEIRALAASALTQTADKEPEPDNEPDPPEAA